jgi:hypothetical protein
MMSAMKIILTGTVLFLFASLNVSAHHAAAPHYDHSRDVLIENAMISEFKMVNPHSFIYFDAPGAGNEIANWRCELRPAAVLLRMGWTQETLAVGQSVTVTGNPAWREDNVCLLQAVVFPDGTEIGPRTDLSSTASSGPRVQAIENDSENRLLTLANGQPNISGDWASLSFTRGGLGGGSREPINGFDPSEANIVAADGYDIRFDDPVLHCHPINIIQGWNHDVHVNRITQLDDRVVLNYGFVDLVRTIYLDAEHPVSIEPSIGGHSIGTWQDDVLVVDTIGFIPGVLSHRVGVLHSDQMHVTERIYYDEAAVELVRDYVVEDPLYLDTPYVNQDRQRISTESFSPYNCLDLSGKNNLRPGI